MFENRFVAVVSKESHVVAHVVLSQVDVERVAGVQHHGCASDVVMIVEDSVKPDLQFPVSQI